MKIRSVTVFCQPGFPPNRLLLQQLGIFGQHAHRLYSDAGYEVESLRLATPPFADFIGPDNFQEAALTLAIEAHAEGFDYVSLGPVPSDRPELLELIPSTLAQSQNVFFSTQLTTPAHEVSLPSAQACARLITQLAKVEPNGFANLNFCALANVPAYAPFSQQLMPSQVHLPLLWRSKQPTWQEKFFLKPKASTPPAKTLSQRSRQMLKNSRLLLKSCVIFMAIIFKGLDFTLAPHPAAGVSIAKALEALGLPALACTAACLHQHFLRIA